MIIANTRREITHFYNPLQNFSKVAFRTFSKILDVKKNRIKIYCLCFDFLFLFFFYFTKKVACSSPQPIVAIANYFKYAFVTSSLPNISSLTKISSPRTLFLRSLDAHIIHSAQWEEVKSPSRPYSWVSSITFLRRARRGTTTWQLIHMQMWQAQLMSCATIVTRGLQLLRPRGGANRR